jgi:hypothetical protein
MAPPAGQGWVLLPALRTMPSGRSRRQVADRSECGRSHKELPDGPRHSRKPCSPLDARPRHHLIPSARAGRQNAMEAELVGSGSTGSTRSPSRRQGKPASGPVAMRDRTEAAIRVASKGSSAAKGSSSPSSHAFQEAASRGVPLLP